MRFARSASARARCVDSYSRARSSACAQCCATDDEQRLVFVVEVHRDREVKRQHADRRAFDQQRQRRRRLVAAVGRDRRRSPEALLPVLERSDEHRLPGLHRRGRAQAVLDRHARADPALVPAVGLGVQRLELRAVVHEQQHFAGGRADDDAAVRDDGARDGLHRHRFRQRGAQRVQPAGARGERAIPRLAGAQRVLDLLALGQLLVRLRRAAFSASDRARSANSSCHVRSSACARVVGRARPGTRDRPSESPRGALRTRAARPRRRGCRRAAARRRWLRSDRRRSADGGYSRGPPRPRFDDDGRRVRPRRRPALRRERDSFAGVLRLPVADRARDLGRPPSRAEPAACPASACSACSGSCTAASIAARGVRACASAAVELGEAIACGGDASAAARTSPVATLWRYRRARRGYRTRPPGDENGECQGLGRAREPHHAARLHEEHIGASRGQRERDQARAKAARTRR